MDQFNGGGSIEQSSRRVTGPYEEIALFDVELDNYVRLYAMRLLERPGGQRIVQAPTMVGGRRSATLAPDMARKLTALASKAFTDLKGIAPNDRAA